MQAIHSVEEFIFRFYERFPPMRFFYRDAPHLAKPAFAVSNALLVLIALFCFYYWVQPAKKSARAVVWIWIVIESANVVAHFVWAIFIGGYNPGLVTAILFVPVLIYLCCLMKRVSSRGVLGRVEPGRSPG
ncbi:MAG: HXXEE domain-containing protein [Pyrinomonadaceae bacterium]